MMVRLVESGSRWGRRSASTRGEPDGTHAHGIDVVQHDPLQGQGSAQREHTGTRAELTICFLSSTAASVAMSGGRPLAGGAARVA